MDLGGLGCAVLHPRCRLPPGDGGDHHHRPVTGVPQVRDARPHGPLHLADVQPIGGLPIGRDRAGQVSTDRTTRIDYQAVQATEASSGILDELLQQPRLGHGQGTRRHDDAEPARQLRGRRFQPVTVTGTDRQRATGLRQRPRRRQADSLAPRVTKTRRPTKSCIPIHVPRHRSLGAQLRGATLPATREATMSVASCGEVHHDTGVVRGPAAVDRCVGKQQIWRIRPRPLDCGGPI
jgi:hypothetical protein